MRAKYRFLQSKKNVGKDLTGTGYAAHIVHNCLWHAAVDNLPVYVESLVVKIYKFFTYALFRSNSFVT